MYYIILKTAEIHNDKHFGKHINLFVMFDILIVVKMFIFNSSYYVKNMTYICRLSKFVYWESCSQYI